MPPTATPPRRTQAFGERSKENLSRLVVTREVEASCHEKDRYGREVCLRLQATPIEKSCFNTVKSSLRQWDAGRELQTFVQAL